MRLETQERLSKALASLEDRDLAALVAATEPTQGWGSNRVLEVGGEKVFCKSVPLTQKEYARPHDTANLYELPTYYNYGVGSAGFGVFRELAAHVKTTAWVLEGACKDFPLMHHHRILPRAGKRPGMSEEELKDYVRYWNGSAAVGRYIEARMAAEYEVVFFLEFIPEVLAEWLPENLERSEEVESQMLNTFDFLREKEFLHLDAHAYNLLTDGKRCYLTDFGLTLDVSYDLSADEKTFLEKHRHFDAAEFLTCMPAALHSLRGEWSEKRTEDYRTRFGDLKVETLMEHLDELTCGDEEALPQGYVQGLRKHAALNNYMNSFFQSMKSVFKDSEYDDVWVAEKLAEARRSSRKPATRNE